MVIDLCKAKCIVIKVGSALITNDGLGINQEMISYLAKVCNDLSQQDKRVVIVSSGAIAEGMARMKLIDKPKELNILQALAAIGQMSLVQQYQSCFSHYQLKAAQVLLTHDDRNNRRRYLNANHTLAHLFNMGVIPIINENDTVADDEIRFGDNDTLAAFASNLVEADLMMILTDQKGLFTANPRKYTEAEFVSTMPANHPELLSMATTEGGALGSGGMHTKILAARQAALGGTHTVLAHGAEEDVVNRVLQRKMDFTLLWSDLPKKTIAEL